MIGFFRVNDPIKMLFLFVLIVVLRLPALLYGTPLTVEELDWMLLGEKMSKGFVLYRDIDTNIAPLSAGTYWLIFSLFGKSQFAFQVISLVIVYIQALIFNFAMDRTDVLKERSYLPALLYIVFASLFFDCFSLPPVLLSLFFLTPALRELFYMLKTGNRDEGVYNVGFYVGLATLFYFPSIIFLLMVVFSYLLYTSTIFRRYLLLIGGFVFPILMIGFYFYLRDGASEYVTDFIWNSIFIHKNLHLSIVDMLKIALIPAALLIWALTKHLSSRGFVNYQTKCHRIMFMWCICAVINLVMTTELAPYNFLLFVPALAYYPSNVFLMTRRKMMGELLFLVVMVLICFNTYHAAFSPKQGFYSLERYTVNIDEEFSYENKKVFVLGADKAPYLKNEQATRFFNWRMAHPYFKDLDNMAKVVKIGESFEKDMPDVIVDRSNIANLLFTRLRFLREKFVRDLSQPGIVYVRKELK